MITYRFGGLLILATACVLCGTARAGDDPVVVNPGMYKVLHEDDSVLPIRLIVIELRKEP